MEGEEEIVRSDVYSIADETGSLPHSLPETDRQIPSLEVEL